MEKTILEWFNELPEQTRIKAFMAHDKAVTYGQPSKLMQKTSTMSMALETAFRWRSADDPGFWINLHNAYRTKEEEDTYYD